MALEQTLSIIKPDAVSKGHVDGVGTYRDGVTTA